MHVELHAAYFQHGKDVDQPYALRLVAVVMRQAVQLHDQVSALRFCTQHMIHYISPDMT